MPAMKWFSIVLLLASIILMADPASSSIYPFGSKVQQNQSDIGLPLHQLPSDMFIGFWDIGTPGYDVDDPVYLHMNYLKSCITSANDVRLSFFGNASPGSKIGSADSDMNKPLTRLPSIICFLNENGSQAYDLNDPVYLHQMTNCDYNRCCHHACSSGTKDDSESSSCHDSENSKDLATGFFERLPYQGEEIISRAFSYATFTDGYKLFISDILIDSSPKKVGDMHGLTIERIKGLKADYYHVLGTWLVKIKAHDNVGEGSAKDGKWDDKCDDKSGERCDSKNDDGCGDKCGEQCDSKCDDRCGDKCDEQCDSKGDDRCSDKCEEQCDSKCDDRCQNGNHDGCDSQKPCCNDASLRNEFIQTNDIILSSMRTDLENGTKITNGMDRGMIALPPLDSFLGCNNGARVGFFDENGNGIYDYKDDLYLNVPADYRSNGIVAVNNVRLSGPV